jgi:hypothetical protein
MEGLTQLAKSSPNSFSQEGSTMAIFEVEARDLKPGDVLYIEAWNKALGTVETLDPETDFDGSRHVMVGYQSPIGANGYVRFGRRDLVTIQD